MDIVMEIVFEILDFIFDIVTDILYEGTVKNMKLPTILRILFVFLIFLVYLGISGVLLYLAYCAYLNEDILLTFVFGGIGLFFLIGGVWETRKVEKIKEAERSGE